MEILFVPNLGDKRKNGEPKWGADFFADAFKKYMPHEVSIEYNLDNMNEYDVVWVHNVANLLKGLRGRFYTFKKLSFHHPPIIGGVRGEIGLKTSKHYLRYFDAIHTGNIKLTEKTSKHNKKAYTLSSGVNPEWYKPHVPPEDFTIGWAGDVKKNMKNIDLLFGLKYPLRMATKQYYTPHDEMPEKFYNTISTLIHPSSHEGSSRVIMESAACGLPIICTNVGHNSTLIDKKWFITLDNPLEQIKERLELLQDPDIYQAVSKANQEAAKKYMWPNIIKQSETIIDETLK